MRNFLVLRLADSTDAPSHAGSWSRPRCQGQEVSGGRRKVLASGCRLTMQWHRSHRETDAGSRPRGADAVSGPAGGVQCVDEYSEAEQIELEVLSANLQRNLAADEGEPDAEFDEKLAQVREKSPFKVALLCLRCEGEEIEVVRIFDELLCKIGLRWRKSRLEVGHRLSLPPVEAALDLDHEDIPAPSVLDGLLDIPEPLFASS